MAVSHILPFLHVQHFGPVVQQIRICSDRMIETEDRPDPKDKLIHS